MKAVFAVVDLVTLGGAVAATKVAGLGAKGALSAAGKTMLSELTANTAAYAAGGIGQELDLPMPLTLLLGAAAGLAAGGAANRALLNKGVGAVDGVNEGGRGANKWKNPDGSVKWPPNNGAVKGTEEVVTMKTGERFGRIGSPDGKYTAPPGTSPDQLFLAPGTDTSLYTEYEVIKEIPNVNRAKVAPWFDQPGGGTQNLMPQTIKQLERAGFIKN